MLLRYPLCALFCYALLCNFDVWFVGKDTKRVTIVVCCHHLLAVVSKRENLLRPGIRNPFFGNIEAEAAASSCLSSLCVTCSLAICMAKPL